VLCVRIAILALLALVFAQDMRSRAVYWLLFPVLTALFIVLAGFSVAAVINIVFLLVQFLLVSAYFSIKKRRWVNVMKGLLGWGDMLFLLSIAFYLSVLNFVFFYIASLLFVLLVAAKRYKHIPLAGLQALLLAALLITDWWIRPFNLTSDDWLLRLINR